MGSSDSKLSHSRNAIPWGIGRAAPDEVPKGMLWERYYPEQKEPARHLGSESLFAGFEFLRSTDPSELSELHSILIEDCKRYASIACVVNVPLGWLVRLGSDFSVRALIKRWKPEGPCPLYFDFGRAEPLNWIDPSMIVSDPLWGTAPLRCDYWRIHGWHPERWVRLYSRGDLEELAKRAKRHRPRAVVLCHSMRVAQLNQLRILGDPT